MTVIELLSELINITPELSTLIYNNLKIDPTTQIILQKEAEGNGYSPLYGVDKDCVYVKDSEYSGEVYSLEEIEKEANCIVFHPVN